MSTGESNVRCGGSIFPFASLVFLCISSVFFKDVDHFEEQMAPGIAVSMTCGEGLFETVFVAFLLGSSLWLVDGSPYRAIFGRGWSSIQETRPAHLWWYLNSMASMLGISACFRISTFVMKSLQQMLRMVW